MLSLNEVKIGTIIEYNDKPYQVVWSEHSKQGRGGAILRTKIRNLIDQTIIEKTFRGNDKLEKLDLEKKEYQYLYQEDNNLYFMDPVNFDQITIDKNNLQDKSKFLSEGTSAEILFYNNNPIAIDLPIKMTFEIIYTEPGIKGDTKSSGSIKTAEINTGAIIKVPLFINKGDKIIVDTRTGQYIERA